MLTASRPRSLSLAKKLRALSHAQFVALAQETYLGLLACIELVNLQAQVLVAEWQTSRREEAERRQRRRGAPAETPSPLNPISSSSHLAVPSGPESSPSPPEPTNSLETRSTTSEDANTLATEITDVVHAVAELANVRFSKVIGVRTEVHAQLALAEFVQIFDLSWDFVVQCERICQRMIVGLRGAMVAQAKTFLQAFHQRQITENARVVEEEQWAAVEVTPTVQASVACIIQIATSDPPELLLGSRSSASSASSTASGSIPRDTDSAEDSSPKTVAGPAKQLDIEGKQFFAVSAGLTTIVALMEYLKVLVNAPMLSTDVMSKIIEFMKVCPLELPLTIAASAHLASSGRSSTLVRAKWSSALARCARPASRTSRPSISVSSLEDRFSTRSRLTCSHANSPRLASTFHHGFAHPLHPRGCQAASQPEAGRHAHRIRQVEA